MRFMPFNIRILLAFWGVLIVTVCLPGIYFYRSLENETLDSSRKEAFVQLDFISWLAQKQPPFESSRGLNDWIGKVSQKIGYRVTVITASGVVLADSAFSYDEIRFLENHAGRPEVAKALSSGRGSSLRYSDTLKRSIIYVARQIELASLQSPLVLRLAIPRSQAETRLNTYARRFMGVVALIFVLTFLVSIVLSRRLRSPVNRVIDQVRAIGAGDYSHRYIFNSGQEFYQLSGAVNDMADRISQQMEIITRQKQELEAILANMREGVMLLDREGRIQTINHTLENIGGCHLACIGKKPMEVFLSTEVQAACDRIIAGIPEMSLTLTLDGDSHFEVYLVRVPEGGALVVFNNISERKRLEKIRQDFVANVSHELKTPLTSIKGYVETLVTGGFSLPEDVRSFLQTILKNTNLMSNIVNDLLELTRLQEKPPSENLLTVNATRCFQTAWENSVSLAAEKQIVLENRLKSVLPVRADENALVRVFGNLIQNALRYTPDSKTIIVYSEEKQEETLFAIRDQGPGIAPKHQTRIFERFYRVDRERSRQSGGTGLGLAICRNAVTGMGGRIWVQSPPADATTGSVFFFTLPRSQAEDGSDPDQIMKGASEA